MSRKTTITGGGIRDETIESVDLASGSIKADELSEESISGQPLITSADTTNDRLLLWDATDSLLKQVSIGNLGVTAAPAGSDGQIQYNDGGVIGGAASFYWDDATGRVGIGTSAPESYLDIKNTVDDGTTNRTMLRLYNYRDDDADHNDFGAISIDFEIENIPGGSKKGLARIAAVQAPSGSDHGIPAGEKTSGLIFSTMDDEVLAEAMRINHLGNVGIGITDPQYAMSVSGFVSSSAGFIGRLTDADNDTYVTTEVSADEDKVKFYTGGNLRMSMRNYDESVMITDNTVPEFTPNALLHVSGAGSGGNNLFAVGGGSNNKPYAFIIDQNGHVGIGDWWGENPNPITSLHVSGSVRTEANFEDGYGKSVTNLYVLESGNDDGLRTMFTFGNYYSNPTAHYARCYYGLDPGTKPPILSFHYLSGERSEALYVNSEGRIGLAAGNNTKGRVTISGSLVLYSDDDTDAGSGYNFDILQFDNRNYDGTADEHFFMGHRGSTFVLGQNTSQYPPCRGVGGTQSERMRFDTDGNVAIVENLVVSGNLRIEGVATGGSPLVLSGGVIINEMGSPEANFRVESGTHPAMLFVDGGTDKIGIATSTPNRTLDITDPSNPQLRLTQTNATKYVDMRATANGDLEITGSAANPHFKFIGDGHTAIIIESTGSGDTDAIISFSVDGGATIPWSMGCDNSDSDKFKIGTLIPDIDSKFTIDPTGVVISGSLGVRAVSWFTGDESANTGQRIEFLADADAPGLTNYQNGAFWARSVANNSSANTTLEATSVIGDMLGPALYTTHMYHYGVNGTPASSSGNVRRYTDNSSANNFTGQHNVLPAEGTGIVENLVEHVGLIVRSTGEYCRFDEPSSSWISGAPSITISEALPRVELTTTANDKSAFGVISNMPNEYLVSTENEEYEQDQDGIAKGFGNIYQEQVRINSIGEGAIWVVNTAGNLENGDYITSSALPGYGMKQADDLLHNHSVAKITQDCDFDLSSSAYKCEELELNGETYRKAFVGCTYHCG